MNDIPISLVENECELFYSKYHYKINIQTQDFNLWESDIKKYCESSEYGIISIGYETLYQDKMDLIINLIRKYNDKFKLHSSNISFNKNTLSAYTYFSILHSTSFEYDVDELNVDYSIVRGEPNNILSRHIFLYKSNFFKTNPYIISSRRYNHSRGEIYDKLNIPNPTGIIRFTNTESDEFENMDIYVSTEQLLKEYNQSFISIVLETCVDSNRDMGYYIPMTEKTLIAFNSKTLPIIVGNRRLSNRLNELGFWTANKLFNIDDTSDDVHEHLVDVIHNIDKLKLHNIHEIYNDNFDKIENNHKLVTKLFNIGRSYNSEYSKYKYLY